MAPAKAAEQSLTFHLDGKAYEVDDLPIGDLEWLEEECGARLDELDFKSMRVIVRIVYLLKKLDNPDFTLEEARKIKFSVLDDSGNGNGDGERPTKAASGGKSGNGRRTSRSSA